MVQIKYIQLLITNTCNVLTISKLNNVLSFTKFIAIALSMSSLVIN